MTFWCQDLLRNAKNCLNEVPSDHGRHALKPGVSLVGRGPKQSRLRNSSSKSSTTGVGGTQLNPSKACREHVGRTKRALDASAGALAVLNSRLVVAASAVESSGQPEGTPQLTQAKIEAQEEFESPAAEPTSGIPLNTKTFHITYQVQHL